MTILISTYEGTHNHPLPMSATAMASATSAAAAMLLTGPSSSSSSSSSTAADLHGLNFSLSTNTSTNPKSPYNLPISSSSSPHYHPTIILDLTTSSSSSSSSSSSQQFASILNRFTSPNLSRSNNYTSTNLNFSNNSNTLMNFGGTNQLPYNHQMFQTRTGSSYNQFGRSSYSLQPSTQSNLDHIGNGINNVNNQVQSLPAETIKAITTDPSFQSALATALSSIISGDQNKKIDERRNEDEKNP